MSLGHQLLYCRPVRAICPACIPSDTDIRLAAAISIAYGLVSVVNLTQYYPSQ